MFDILGSAVDLVWSHITVEGDSYQRYIIGRKGSRLGIKRRIMIVDIEGWLLDKHKKKRPRGTGISPTKPLLLEGFEYEKLYVYILAYIPLSVFLICDGPGYGMTIILEFDLACSLKSNLAFAAVVVAREFVCRSEI